MTNEKKIFEKLARMKREGKLDEFYNDDLPPEALNDLKGFFGTVYTGIEELDDSMGYLQECYNEKEEMKEVLNNNDFRRFDDLVRDILIQWDNFSRNLDDTVYTLTNMVKTR